MDFPLLPKKLVTACHGIIEGYHNRTGYSGLMKFLSQKDTMVFILVHDDLRGLLGAGIAAWRIAVLCFIGCGILLLAGIFSWWIVMGVVPLFATGIYFRRRSNSFDVTIAAILMSLELIANDFSEVSKFLPDAYHEAREKLCKYLLNHPTRFLDLYMPGVAGVEGQEFRSLLSGLFESESRQKI